MTMTANPELLRDELFAILGSRGLLEPDDFAGRSCDPFLHEPIASPFVTRPANAAELSEVIKVAARHDWRIVTHGGVTGMSGGAFTRPDTIVVSTERMRQIEEINEIGQFAVVGAGVSVEELQNAVEEKGLFYPVDLGSKGSATIGGTISTNAGGNHVIRWGMTRQSVLGIEAVLADGTVVNAMNRLLKNNTGFDLKHYLIGSEGTLGIVTRAVVRLQPLPTSQEVALLGVESMEKVLKLLMAARNMPSLSAFEVMWHDYYALMAESGTGRRPIEPDLPYYVLIESMGYDADADRAAFERFMELALEQGLAADGVLANSARQKQDLWHVREGSEVTHREFGAIVPFDVSVDLEHVEAFVSDAYRLLRERFTHVRGVTLGHLGDNNIHFGINVGPQTVEQFHAVEDAVFEALAPYGGAITAEHGIGSLKREFLHKYKSEGELEMMKRIKAALDPHGRLNPGVIFEE
ncbi:FAD-binding oxidoreductase [Aquisediminimonas sediminicola]|uniref:FAD-binding oxidoreductase n=1 Tax=Alteraquisediminimonas sediminicola TaxID=2676787 RepID=UPI001C8DB175|nr:FAD-binding oxidoreductase [Aquisediminimonas sediminicola]